MILPCEQQNYIQIYMNINENPTTTTSISLVNDRILYRIFASAFAQNLIQASLDALFSAENIFFTSIYL